jgi:hypothetical protein
MQQRMQQMMQQMGGGGGGPAVDTPLPDTAEKIQISSLSLLKMLKHGTNYRQVAPMSFPSIMINSVQHIHTTIRSYKLASKA